MAERLQKVMARAGVASRRKSETLISTGHVQVNGTVIRELGTKVTADDAIQVDGVAIQQEQFVYYLLYKPRSVVSTAHDDKGRRTVVDLLDDIDERIYPVGRLDYDTSGLLLMTNDGELANQLMHPKFKVDKTYVAKVKGVPTNDALEKLRHGLVVDGHKTSPAKSKLISVDHRKNTAIVQLTIHEGHNHQVKNMLTAVGFPVEKLRRDSYGPLTLDGLTSGDYRELKSVELEALRESISNKKGFRR
ncbi:MAG: rRNA pseudouridine synthase [Furfurilactobacillus sp.]|jgi:23S rRNA pseudouridine2605 synthase|nr:MULTISPECIES: pseudouridine synthase [Furfurilactobacillus]MCF6159959.1 rRNA pseudouridine synthase [Furfurilactobacillus milii]MCF6162492.1 rRNA pseudouridine synthase [Furfurilactobacillus milii]MCF6165551.1 rRNA pseudouridine synthase [Furfurilactobacillus rossiae]MCF6419337.1 rRNA pseudouridine synthase [Furfurilactobacillus milii]MCH4010787.1 rRNA pseudouridine synthase [Furfurilactobacillus sp.]